MKRNKFSLSNTRVFSGDMGELLPAMRPLEVLPGDSIQAATSLLLRVSPLLAPVMHTVRIRTHWWFVPHRIVWEEWEDFITGGPDGMSTPVFPYIAFGGGTGAAVGSLADYMGVTPLVDGIEVSALPFRGYARIWNEYYRDQDLQTKLTIDLTSGQDTTTSVALQNVAWEKDYFTSARPWTQKGPEVTIPLTGDAYVKGLGVASGSTPQTADTSFIGPVGDNPQGPFLNWYQSNANNFTLDAAGSSADSALNLYADLSGVSAANINELRLAFALQRYEEARARWGSRYVEYLRYLGVRSSDARLQRPEYLGGGRQTIQFSEVLQTADNVVEDEVVDAVGTLRGHGIGASRSNRFRRFFEEHGYVHCLISVLPKTQYIQGIPRSYMRRTKEDFWQRELEHIGQQELYKGEIYAQGGATDYESWSAYQDRYDEYRRQESDVAGEFRTTSLDFWHMARKFSSLPTLNADFVKSNPTKRINAVQSEDVLWMQARHSIQARRQLSMKGTSYIF